MPGLLFANKNGELFDLPGVAAVARWGNQWVDITDEDLIPLPEGATLTLIPERYPIGISEETGEFVTFKESPYDGEEIWAVGALLPQGYTRTLLPGFVAQKNSAPLPLLGYTAVAIVGNEYYVAAIPTAEDKKWNPKYYNTPVLEELVEDTLQSFSNNRIIAQLAKCSLEYGCFTAQNIFYGRWEGGIPVSPACNANCLGCISLQPSECCPSPQNRIDFIPSVEEVSEVAIKHLENAEDAIVSFGQGCEGEPTLQGDLLIKAVDSIRSKTGRGTINLNTNGSRPEIIEALAKEGLQSIRVSIISPEKDNYDAYYRPSGYQVSHAKRALRAAGENGVYTSINLLTIPGFTDSELEVKNLIRFLKETGVCQVQFRNLNIDPDYFFKALPDGNGELLGIPRLVDILQQELPHLKIGSYTLPVK
ncbi:MAG: hypothetical protein PWQ96_1180 [Clostridia bacterium]|jgi:pyruvate-formate lyase-activating enzyme|nr:hypothetical protein [Clostridiales bacterium]MDK2985538.1 hypothetical protein [Clostridia bacterium]